MAGVFRLAGEAADGVDLPGAAAPAFDLLPGEIAAAQLDARGALAKALEIDVQGAGAIERAQGANAVAKPREDDGKLGAFGQAAGALELGGRLEADGHNVDGGWFRVEAGDDWRGAGFPDGLGDACHVELFRRSEEHTSELQSPCNLVCRLLLGSEEHTSELQSPCNLVCRLLLGS